jgi:hypothetical protein
MTHPHTFLDAAHTGVLGAVVPPYPPPPLANATTTHYSYSHFFHKKNILTMFYVNFIKKKLFKHMAFWNPLVMASMATEYCQ